MVKGSKLFEISLNDTTYTTDDFTRANKHLETVLTYLDLLNFQAVAQAMMNMIFFECDTIMVMIGDDTLTIRKIK